MKNSSISAIPSSRPFFGAARSILALLALASCVSVRAGEQDPETVYAISSVKQGQEAEFLKVSDQAWATYKRLDMVMDQHVTVKGVDEKGLTYFVDILTWKNHFIPDHVSPEVRQIWDKMESLCEKRDGRRGIEFTEVELIKNQVTP